MVYRLYGTVWDIRVFLRPKFEVIRDRAWVFIMVPPWGSMIHYYLSEHPPALHSEQLTLLMVRYCFLCYAVSLVWDDYRSYLAEKTPLMSVLMQVLCMAYSIVLFIWTM